MAKRWADAAGKGISPNVDEEKKAKKAENDMELAKD